MLCWHNYDQLKLIDSFISSDLLGLERSIWSPIVSSNVGQYKDVAGLWHTSDTSE